MAKIIRRYKYRAKTICKNNFEKDFFKLVNNAVFGKTMDIVRNNRHIKFIIAEARRNYLESELNYHTTKNSQITY